jgi:hypothetical protein
LVQDLFAADMPHEDEALRLASCRLLAAIVTPSGAPAVRRLWGTISTHVRLTSALRTGGQAQAEALATALDSAHRLLVREVLVGSALDGIAPQLLVLLRYAAVLGSRGRRG